MYYRCKVVDLGKNKREMLFFRKKITAFGILCVYLQQNYNMN